MVPFAPILLCAAVSTGTLAAQTGPVARIPVQVVADKLLVRCDISTRSRRIPVNLFIELETPVGLELHNDAATPLETEAIDGTTQPITVHFDSLELVVEQRELGDQDILDEFTKWNSREMGETAVVGKLGSRVLKDYHLTFDLHAGVLEVRQAFERREGAPGAAPGETVLPITTPNDQVWLPVRLADGSTHAMLLGTARFDTTVDGELAEQLGAPAGNIGEVRVGDARLDEFVALRPVELNQTHDEGALGVLGLNFLKHFRVSIDRVNQVARLRRVREPDFPDEDLAFFRVLVEDRPEALVAFLTEHGESRLASEAARLLLELAIDRGGDRAEFETALTWIDRTTPADLRCTSSLAQMKRLKEANLPDVAVLAGRIGLPSGREDRYPESVHDVHGQLGHLLLEADDEDGAWRHLLSAAFGKQEDGRVNLDLGRFYERQGRLRRAESRYVQALIDADTGAEAFEGLARVRAGLGDTEPLSFDEVERRIEGKVLGFGAATRYVPAVTDVDADARERGVLLELFTNPDMTRAGVQGGCLAFEGLRRHFEDGPVAFLTYHMSEPELVPLANELVDETVFVYGLAGPRVMVLDGVARLQGACTDEEVQKLYDKLRSRVKERLGAPAEFTLELSGVVEGTRLEGELVVRGPRRADTVVQLILAERGVLFPGRSGVVLHRMVARAGLTTPVTGASWQPTEGDALEQRFPFACDTLDVARANLAWLEARAAQGLGLTGAFGTAIDPRQLTLVAIVRDAGTNEVLQAQEFTPEGAEGDQR